MTSTRLSGQQWDAPNAWSPLQDLLVSGLEDSGHPGAVALAREAAQRWLANSLSVYEATGGGMWEKLRAEGGVGAGGEYPTVGGEAFGWSNGVAIKFALRFNFSDV